MGYYDRSDLRFYYALADAFTICDAYHCSVIGPTDPNRLMSMSATIDPAGAHGGPLLQTNLTRRSNAFSWRTMPEQLSAKGVSWKVYSDPGGGVLDNVLTYFKQCTPGSKLNAQGVKPTYPADFMADLSGNQLPQVSWVLTSIADTEHPDFSTPQAGEAAARAVVEAILSNPKIWQKTALFITWDENGGFFDHVTPPTPPKGTAGEYLTVAKLPSDTNSLLGDAEGIRGPIGLGFRVPMLVVSPFSRGGLVCSDTFDHTSTLRFLETRFGAQVPNLSKWRRGVTGDLTSAFNFAASPNVREAFARQAARRRHELLSGHLDARELDCGRVPQAGERQAQAPQRDREALAAARPRGQVVQSSSRSNSSRSSSSPKSAARWPSASRGHCSSGRSHISSTSLPSGSEM